MSEVVSAFLGNFRTGILEGLASGTSRDVPSSPNCSSWDRDSRGASLQDVRGSPIFFLGLSGASLWDFQGCPK